MFVFLLLSVIISHVHCFDFHRNLQGERCSPNGIGCVHDRRSKFWIFFSSRENLLEFLNLIHNYIHISFSTVAEKDNVLLGNRCLHELSIELLLCKCSLYVSVSLCNDVQFAQWPRFFVDNETKSSARQADLSVFYISAAISVPIYLLCRTARAMQATQVFLIPSEKKRKSVNVSWFPGLEVFRLKLMMTTMKH